MSQILWVTKATGSTLVPVGVMSQLKFTKLMSHRIITNSTSHELNDGNKDYTMRSQPNKTSHWVVANSMSHGNKGCTMRSQLNITNKTSHYVITHWMSHGNKGYTMRSQLNITHELNESHLVISDSMSHGNRCYTMRSQLNVTNKTSDHVITNWMSPGNKGYTMRVQLNITNLTKVIWLSRTEWVMATGATRAPVGMIPFKINSHSSFSPTMSRTLRGIIATLHQKPTPKSLSELIFIPLPLHNFTNSPRWTLRGVCVTHNSKPKP